MAFIDDCREAGHAVEPVCRVPREQGLEIAARTYRAWKQASRPVADRVVSDAQVIDALDGLRWRVNVLRTLGSFPVA